MPQDRSHTGRRPYAKGFLRARKEAVWIMLAFVFFLVWCIAVSGGMGYEEAATEAYVGIPRWVWLGVIVPWVFATAFTVWFALRVMTDDDAPRQGKGGDG